MSDASIQNLKVSREGIVLIKSFEGFRPRAVQREAGGWIIGYGHTLSAREGASVSEADAELLLRYDLLPVEKTVNETTHAALNQHQFDALISFAFSVGIDRFVTSDVLQRLTAGAPGEAADAMIGWPEPALPETALRRRAAERALFVADPGSPVSLAALLVAPLPPPAMVEAPVAAGAEPTPATVDMASTAEHAPEHVQPGISADPRVAALAVLLGEPDETDDAGYQGEPASPSDAFHTNPEPAPEPEPPLAAAGDPAVQPSGVESSPVEDTTRPDEAEAERSNGPDATDTTLAVPGEADAPRPATSDPAVDEASVTVTPEAEMRPSTPGIDAFTMTAKRYSPYGASIVGPLPFLSPAETTVEAVEPASIARSVTETVTEIVTVPEGMIRTTPEPILEATPTVLSTAELILTSPEDTPEPVFSRPLWDADQREQTETDAGTSLFGEDLTLTLGGSSILRHEIEMEPPARFDWSQTGAFVIMGAVGLTSFGASMAAFRLAFEQSGGRDETTIIAWVLAVIGGACVGVSSINLYRKLGLPGGD